MKDITEEDEDKDEEEHDEDSEEGAVGQWVQTEVEAASREGANNLMSSGVLLQPKTLVENHTQPFYP